MRPRRRSHHPGKVPLHRATSPPRRRCRAHRRCPQDPRSSPRRALAHRDPRALRRPSCPRRAHRPPRA
ncbi:MAG TPA: hypothetical protein ENJ18_00040 [Nannocystis exedens]|nr:hypothetical protein [Nannocystis exedens]